MSSKAISSPSSPVHPPVGTLIDGDSLELVEVLGVGGYGVVYRAVETHSITAPKSYAVKCLVHTAHHTSRQRQIHIREIALHQIASVHPGVVTLHRVVENYNHTYIIMDYAPDHDLFTQILHSCRYLGDDALIKHVFLQLLDAVEYCHSLGIFHRDLKPENVLCFDDGLRVAITDFGLATTDKFSDEFRTGSVYHMSPECQGGEFAPTGKYSPMFNDIWSLGIILLNLATGRNPWKSATLDDPTFQAYLHDPLDFLTTVLPISLEANDLLVRMLDVDWRERATLREVRRAIEEIESFYSDGVIFEGSMARCPWEAGMEIDSDSSSNTQDEPSPPRSLSPQQPSQNLASHWSKETTSDIVFASRSFAAESSYGVPWTGQSSCGATWAFESSTSFDLADMDVYDGYTTPPPFDTPDTSLPNTPNPDSDIKTVPRLPLTINTNISRSRFQETNQSTDSFSTRTSLMQTAIEYDPYSSMFLLSSANSTSNAFRFLPDSATIAVTEDKEMLSPSIWASSATEMSSPSLYSDTSSVDGDIVFSRSATPSPELEPVYSYCTQVQCPASHQSQPSPSISAIMTNVILPPQRPFKFTPLKKTHDGKTSIFTLKLFPRASPSIATSLSPLDPLSQERHRTLSLLAAPKGRQAPSPSPSPHSTPNEVACWTSAPPKMATCETAAAQSPSSRRTPQLRSPRHWFIPGRFFASTGATA